MAAPPTIPWRRHPPPPPLPLPVTPATSPQGPPLPPLARPLQSLPSDTGERPRSPSVGPPNPTRFGGYHDPHRASLGPRSLVAHAHGRCFRDAFAGRDDP